MADNQQILQLDHWNYFLTLEDDLKQLSRYLEINKGNYRSYSIELARILFAASSEIDVVAKQLCKKLRARTTAKKINSYRGIITKELPHFYKTKIRLRRSEIILKPWSEWGKNKKPQPNPEWWWAYNKVKHERHTHFRHANLKNTLNSVAGLFVMVLYFYRDEAQSGELSPDPSLLLVSDPIKAERLAGSHQKTLDRRIKYTFPDGC